LTVEDDKDTQRMYKMILEKYEISIISEAHDGREALERYKEMEEKPRVVLLDYNIPYLNGVEVAKKILGIQPNQKIIFVTGNGELEEILPVELEKKPVVKKPLEFRRLVHQVANIKGRQDFLKVIRYCYGLVLTVMSMNSILFLGKLI